MKITHKTEKPLLERTEIVAELEGAATPSNVELRKQIAAKMNVNEDVVVMKKIATGFGSTKLTASAYIYKDAKARAKFEPTTAKSREEAKKAKEAAEAQAKAEAEAKASEAKA